MTILDIVTPPDPILRQKARKVRSFTPELERLLDDMVETMRAAPGVGLAAPQVGERLRVITVEFAIPPEDPEQEPNPPQLYKLVNPEITRHSAETVSGAEGCLSIPGYMGQVERYQSVTVKGFTPKGQRTAIKADGWLARIFQHEIDHLDGVLFIDRALEVWKLEEQETSELASPG